jgi:hypothetical protein
VNVLVVVDMQHMYNAARDPGLIAKINTSMRQGWSRVVLLCNDGSGMHTIEHEGKPVLWKDEANGGDCVYSYLLGILNPPSRALHVTFAGVNLSQCVYRTAEGLARRLAQEHGMTDNVTIDLSLCGDGEQFVVRLKP